MLLFKGIYGGDDSLQFIAVYESSKNNHHCNSYESFNNWHKKLFAIFFYTSCCSTTEYLKIWPSFVFIFQLIYCLTYIFGSKYILTMKIGKPI